MTEYIDKVAFNYAIREAVKKYPNSFYNGLEVARQIAHDFQAADVRPVVRGKWEDETGFIFSDLSQQVRCSKCGLIAYFYDKMPMNFCPNCGADMRNLQSDSTNANNSEPIANSTAEEGE